MMRDTRNVWKTFYFDDGLKIYAQCLPYQELLKVVQEHGALIKVEFEK